MEVSKFFSITEDRLIASLNFVKILAYYLMQKLYKSMFLGSLVVIGDESLSFTASSPPKTTKTSRNAGPNSAHRFCLKLDLNSTCMTSSID